MKIKILADGGNMKPSPALSQKLGPVGINIGEVIKRVNESTKEFNKIKVPVELDIDPKTKEFEILVFSPPVSELIKKELGIEKGSGKQKEIYVANISIEQIINIAKQKLPNLLCNNLKSAIKVVVGTCGSLGILIDNKNAKEIQEEIEKGFYDQEIKNEKTELDSEKKKQLEEHFLKIMKSQEELIKKIESEKAEETNKKEIPKKDIE
jgi:large subunit ribosomal protein L11